MEDPIAAVFDLAESVERQTPTIRKMLRYVRWFVSFWLLLDVFLILIIAREKALALFLFAPIIGTLLAARYVQRPGSQLGALILAVFFAAIQTLTTGDLLIGGLLDALFVLGFVILNLLRDLRSFFDYFDLRHRVILAVRQADPVVHVPQGKDSAAKAMAYLASVDAGVRATMAAPGALVSPALLTGKTGLTYSFDAVLRSEPTSLARVFGLGATGFSVFAKSFEHAPTADDLKSLKTAVEDVSAVLRIPPARVLALWRAHGDEAVSPEAYDFLTRESARVTIRGTTYACSLQLVREGDDGTYDFIPVVMEPVTPAARTAPA